MIYEITIPIRLPSEANLREHWSKRHKRHKNHKAIITLYWKQAQIPNIKPPAAISLTRLAPRTLDDDNLAMSLKNCLDTIANLLIPGLPPGQADNPKHGLTFSLHQKKGLPKTYALIVQLIEKFSL